MSPSSLRTPIVLVAGVALAATSAFALHAWRADAWPGDVDTTFVPIRPCRLLDTRPAPDHVGPHSAFNANDTKTIQAVGTNGACTIPDDASGLSLNVTSTNATAPTFLTIWPEGERPLASSLNPFPGEPPTPNAVNTPLSARGAFNIYNSRGSVNVLVDVNGYYTKSSLKDLDWWTSDLYSAQPFVVTANTSDVLGPPGIVNVAVEAAHDGHVTVISTVAFASWDPDGGEQAECVIVDSTSVPIVVHPSIESYQVVQAPSGQPMSGSLSLTRTFSISSGTTAEYALFCSYSPTGGQVAAANLTAIFTPSY